MGLILTEQAQPSTPASNTVHIYVDSTANTVRFIKDDGTVWQLELNQNAATALPSAPSYPAFIWIHDTGVASILYASMKKTDESWGWEPILEASPP